MSKKKSTMTLKDFHGGIIPSDLPLPSAPGGATVRSGSGSGSLDRTGYDPIGRNVYYCSRPRSSPTMRIFDDNMPFLTHVAHLGRNFDEDERKPLDGGGGLGYNTSIGSDERLVCSLPAIRVVDEGKSAFKFLSSRHESSAPVMEYPRVFARSYTVGGHSESLGMGSSGVVHSYPNAWVSSAHGSAGVRTENLGTGGVHAVSRAYPNAWAPARKEAGAVNDQPVRSVWSESVAVEKLAHASALDKVASGRWQTPRLVSAHADIEVIHYPEPDSGTHLKTWNGFAKNGMTEQYAPTLPEQLEKGLNIEDSFHAAEKQIQDYERPRSPAYSGTKEKNFVGYSNAGQVSRKDEVSGGQDVQPPVHVDASERPKLKLPPRSKPVESFLPSVQEGQTDCGHTENITEAYGSETSERPGSDGTDGVNKVTERPKLKLKPRSLPLQELNVQVERKSHTLFGGARPRELVLKERGIDDVAEKHDPIPIPSPNRVKLDTPKAATVSTHSLSRLNDKTENPPYEINRVAKGSDRMDYRVEVGKGNMQRRNWHNENWKNTRSDNQQKPQQERQHQQHQQLHQQERHRSPET